MASVSHHETKPSTRVSVSLGKEELFEAITDWLKKNGLETPPGHARPFFSDWSRDRGCIDTENPYHFTWDE